MNDFSRSITWRASNSGVVFPNRTVQASVTGFPVTYAVDGRQHVAVSTGNSLNTGALRRLTPELRPSNGNNLFVFALPDRD